jgi:bifunctional UDP-N-acetylglucosamine pyrophosphorylase/glucosamine-1-phosphate N-acetyltransferase
MPAPVNVVILAAGKGTRMVSDRPKVLHRLAGKALLRHVLDAARQLAPAKTCVVYGYGGSAVPQAIDDPAVIWVNQAVQLGTGHALQQALPNLDKEGVTLVLYGDVPLTRNETLAEMLELAQDGALVLLTVELSQPDGYGRIVRGDDGAVLRIVEHKDATAQERKIREINTGIMAIPGGHLARWLGQLRNDNVQGEYYLTDLIGMAVQDGVPVLTCHPRHQWEILGINSKAQLAELERLYQGETARNLLEQGVTLADPARIDVRGELVCGKDVAIDVNCVFEGSVVLGDDVSVGANCVLRNVSVAQGTRIEPFSLLDEARLGARNRIGPFARIRPGTVLQDEVHIGNFVEIKNSQVDAGSKINHLSYVGDSTVGKSVNIGAGTITCNYDGVNKHRTVIEDGAFIGSDTQLVAPVTVGRGATIGAGSTLTRDAPAEELTLSRTRQTTVSGWKRPAKVKK